MGKRCFNPAPNFEEAKARYMAGVCPDCSRKMEHRPRSGDYFCHKSGGGCGTDWNFKKLEMRFGIKPVAALTPIPVATQVATGKVKKSFLERLFSWKGAS